VAYLSTDNGRTFGCKQEVDSYVEEGAYTSCVPVAGKTF